MKLLKPLLILAVIAGAVIAAVKYTGDSKPTLPDETSAVATTGDDSGTSSKKKNKGEAPRMEERYGFTSQTVDP